MTLSTWRRRTGHGTSDLPDGDYLAWQRSYERRIEFLRRNVHDLLDAAGAIVTIVGELLTWRIKR